MKTRTDNFSENANILPYGSNVGAPSIVLPDLDGFKSEKGITAKHHIEQKLTELKRQYEELVQLAFDTDLVYNARYNFVPVVGKIYHLYKTDEDYLLSMIEPQYWNKYKFIGSYEFQSDAVWKKINEG
jgi:hypothetical protein